MIENIKIQGVATYGQSSQELAHLSEINFIYGSNGTGKTTISRVIAGDASHTQSQVTWKGGLPLKTLVYNRDFVEKNFDQPAELKGIFTLGEEDQNTLARISAEKRKLDSINTAIARLNFELEGYDGNGGKTATLKELESQFEAKCWEVKRKYDVMFKDAFAGCLNSKKAFKKRLIQESDRNSCASVPIGELEEKARIIFGHTPENEQFLPVPDWTNLLAHEENPILHKKVIGKADVDIAAMIQKLGNSDWVKQGREFYDQVDRICPFCQQPTSTSLEKSLNEYFDETFASDSAEIEKAYTDYKSDSDRLQRQLRSLLNNPSKHINNVARLQSENEILNSKVQINIQHIAVKMREPSRSIALDSLKNISETMKTIIDETNAAIRKHNTVVSNLHAERRELTGRVWRYLLDHASIKHDLAAYRREKNELEKARDNLERQIRDQKREKDETEQAIRNLESNRTSIQPTIDRINALLKQFGFRDFGLAKSDRGEFYKIRRPDGSNAKETLSEGERSFLLFLYFYHRIKGSDTESGMTSDCIVVFDDPVSSLGSEVLFIVSTLIKGLFDEVRDKTGTIKQIFVLTHNVYFHKEVSFNPKRDKDKKLGEETFWIVRKVNGESKLQRYDTNPVKSSYELLWVEVRQNRDSLTIQNALRMILETYFENFLGGINPDEVCNGFMGEDLLACKSLFSWVNDGSHCADDSPYISTDDSTVKTYLEVFKRIFEKTGHIAHYNMMMQ
ncbi:MAG: AAA family ATPase [Nitrospira sp.]|nr:AAA family ATPase [Nitrospira sp.]